MIRVYKYGLKPPVDFADDCLEELKRMTALWNKLVEIDREREKLFKKLCCDFSEKYRELQFELDLLNTEIDSLYDDIREQRIKSRSKELSPDLQARKSKLLSKRQCIYDDQKSIQETLPKKVKQPLSEKYKVDVKIARQNSGCFWGNYNAVIESFETAKSKAIKEGDGARLHFQRFDGHGRFVNQIQSGMSVSDLFNGKKSQIKISGFTNKQKKHANVTFTAFTGNYDSGKHFRRELTARITYHREIPKNGDIKAVEVIRKKIGNKFKWFACFTVKLPDVEITHPKTNAVGINLGWRQIGSQLRIATLIDNKGHKKEYFLPANLMKKFDVADEIQGKLDNLRNDMIDWIRLYYHETKDRAPQDWKESARLLLITSKPSIEVINKFYSVWQSCLSDFDSKDEFEKFSEWYTENLKLHLSYTGCRRNAGNWRDELYRIYAKEIAENYAVIGLTNTPLAKMNRTKAKSGLSIDNDLPEAARRNRNNAGLYTLKEWLLKQSAKNSAIVAIIEDKVTKTCNKCGHINIKEIGGKQHYICDSCGTELEVDINAAKNCLKLATGDIVRPKLAPKKTKYQRVREAMQERNNTARNNDLQATADAG